eukprot:Anaeramoba_flamelloidesc40881_g1_i2.p1 GENE.c40881_g1_i2~~c40881_g1_i2.p1  ORF type:complete len:381 (-),score=101.50 c40881_g1_i2:140-1255(-)
MKALFLAGGYGTRLRPFTFTKPKPLIDFANEPIILHQIKALHAVGVRTIVLAVNYQPSEMRKFAKEVKKELDIEIKFSLETEPLGTGGPLKLAEEYLKGDEPFFVLNSDVICDFPFAEMLEFHKKNKSEGTILATKVENPSRYGVIVHQENGKIERFVEKPQEFVGDRINAGIYILNPSVLDTIPLRWTSLEREIFPKLAKEEKIYCYHLNGFWMDVGKPGDFILGSTLYLKFISSQIKESKKVKIHGGVLIEGEDIQGAVLVPKEGRKGVQIGENCRIGPNVVIGKNVRIGNGCRLKNCTIMDGVVIGQSSYIENSIIGWGSHIGSWTRIQSHCFLGEDVTVRDECNINSLTVCPHKGVNQNIMKETIML